MRPRSAAHVGRQASPGGRIVRRELIIEAIVVVIGGLVIAGFSASKFAMSCCAILSPLLTGLFWPAVLFATFIGPSAITVTLGIVIECLLIWAVVRFFTWLHFHQGPQGDA